MSAVDKLDALLDRLGALLDRYEELVDKVDEPELAKLRKIKAAHKGHPEITWDQVGEIRARYLTGEVTMQVLSDEYGVTKTTISRIVNRHTRKYR